MLLLIFQGIVNGQNNGIFNGGNLDGFSHVQMKTVTQNIIFKGDFHDGFSVKNYETSTNRLSFKGGNDDGYSIAFVDKSLNNFIFNGGIADGYNFETEQSESNNSIFSGGVNDGFSIENISSESNENIFVGGDGDGYSESKLSKLIWTGAIDKDWLMAGNWNINRTPNVTDYVTVPGGLIRYPVLNGKLLLGKSGEHTYTCSSILIMTGGNVNVSITFE